MMKHDTSTKSIPIGGPNAALEASGTMSLKRGLWRNRSASEAPDSLRSPITKAFDFLPWGRSRKPTDKTQNSQHIPQDQLGRQKQQKLSQGKSENEGANSSSNTNSNPGTKTTDKDASIHYHRNIFRCGGGLIRDILGGDKLNKEKGHNNQQELVLKKSNQRQKPNQVVTRNKSLDLHALISTVDSELSEEKLKNGRTHFMDDTFIENIKRAKEAYRQENKDLLDDETPEEYKFVQDAEEDEHEIAQQRSQQASDEQLHCTASSSGNAALPHPARHILFNDEDTVYLIKKELPVKRELSKAKRKVSASHLALSDKERQQQHQQQKSNHQQRERERDREHSRDRHERSESVLRARLKFKKLTPDATPLPERRATSAQRLNGNQYHNEYTNDIDYGQTSARNYQTSRSVMDNYSHASDGNKRDILQRQNTSQGLVSLGCENGNMNGGGGDYVTTTPHFDSPDNRRRHHQLFQRSEQRTQLQRRKSFTDYDNAQLDNCSSSSSMGGGVGSAAGAPTTNNEQTRAEKPRKKLSFREPVADRGRMRRRSSPVQRPNSVDPIDNGRYVEAEVMADAAAGTTKDFSNRLTFDNDVIVNGNTNKVSCDTLSAGNNSNSSNGSCTALMALSPADNHNYPAQINNQAIIDAAGCYYVDNANLTMDFESQAMRIVRTVGQAFEVCHKFNLHKNSLEHNDERSDVSSELLDIERISEQQLSEDELDKKESLTAVTDIKPPQRPNHLELVPHTSSNMCKSPSLMMADEDKSPTSPLSPSHEISKLKDQLEQQAIQTRQALAQLMLVREQLISETNARIEAQARTQQLLQQNRELLEHLASLGAYSEQQAAGLTSANIGMAPQLSSTAKVARWFQQLPWHTASLSRPESGFVSGDSRSEKFHCEEFTYVKEPDDLCDEFLLVEGSSTIWTKLSAKKQRKLLGMRLGKVTTF